MAVTITLSQLNLELSEVGSVVITDTALDDELGDYVRDIRIMGIAEEEGSNAPMLVQVRVRSATAEAIVIHAPEQEF